MQSQLKTSEKSSAQTTGSGSASPQQERKRVTQRKGKRNFASWDPEVQRTTFLNWLPKNSSMLLGSIGHNFRLISCGIVSRRLKTALMLPFSLWLLLQ